MGDESSPSLRTFANIRPSCSPAEAGVQERGALHFIGPMPNTLHCSVLGPGIRRGTTMKQLNVFPMIILLIIVLGLVYWLRPH